MQKLRGGFGALGPLWHLLKTAPSWQMDGCFFFAPHYINKVYQIVFFKIEEFNAQYTL